MSKDATKGVSIVFINPTTPTQKWTKTIPSSQVTGELKFVIRSSLGTVLLKDDNGLVYMVDLNLDGTTLTAEEFTLDKATYNTLFGKTSYVSISEDIVFVYNNKQISYFQAYETKLYYLGQLDSSIETKSANYRTQYSPKEIKLVLSIFSP